MRLELSEKETNSLIYALNTYEVSRYGLYEFESQLREKLTKLSEKYREVISNE